jgi:histidyl-tRNA synthetase
MAADAARNPRGTRDLLPEDLILVRHLERTAARVAETAGYRELRTPLFEETRLFSRSLGETSDVVEKEMFTVPRRGDGDGSSYTFRPEGTAGAARAYAQGGFAASAPFQKWFYVGPMFRYERPQKGRERQFTQFGAEAFGSTDPHIDAEIVEVALRFFEELGFGSELQVRVNTMGDPEDRARWGDALREYFGARLDERCDDCRTRFERNIFRLLDCKQPACIEANAGAPPLRDVLGEAATGHDLGFREALRAFGREPVDDPGIVRGLDYYTRTVFEIHYPPLGARSALCGGGRYDGLVEQVGGKPTPAVGFSIGFTPTELALQELGLPGDAALEDLRASQRCQAFVVAITDEDRAPALRIVSELRRHGVRADLDFRGKSPKAQFKDADRSGARFAVVVGPDERAAGEAVLRDLQRKQEERVGLDVLAARIAAALAAD